MQHYESEQAQEHAQHAHHKRWAWVSPSMVICGWQYKMLAVKRTMARAIWCTKCLACAVRKILLWWLMISNGSCIRRWLMISEATAVHVFLSCSKSAGIIASHTSLQDNSAASGSTASTRCCLVPCSCKHCTSAARRTYMHFDGAATWRCACFAAANSCSTCAGKGYM